MKTITAWVSRAGPMLLALTSAASTAVAGPFVAGAEQVAVGATHSCAIVAGGFVKCWGDNGQGQLGNGSTSPSSIALDVPGISGAVAIASGEAHSCVITAAPARTVQCWGEDQAGGSQAARTPVAVGNLIDPVAVASGGRFNCALESGGTVKCWGANGNGELGRGNNVSSDVPQPVVNLPATDILDIVAGSNFACARTLGGSVYCWGNGTSGQLGNGGNASSNVPVPVVAAASALALGAGTNHACMAATNGQYYCWGSNQSGALGDTTVTSRNRADTPVVGLAWAGTPRIAAGNQFTCVTSGVGNHCWGYDSTGQFGNGRAGANFTSRSPLAGPGPGGADTFTRISARGQHACAVSTLGNVRCWGSNTFGELGDGYQNPEYTPTATPEISGVLSATAGYATSCIVLADGTARCSGKSDRGQSGDGAAGAATVSGGGRSTFNQVVGLAGVSSVGIGFAHACALSGPGNVSCWGDSSATGFTTTSTPVQVNNPAAGGGPLTGVTSLAIGFQHNCAVWGGGRVSCWGTNDTGQVGDGTGAYRGLPVQILSGGIAVSAGNKHACALMSGGTVKCWGQNTFGGLGDETTQTRFGPVDVHLLTGVSAIAAGGGGHTCAIVAGGNVKCWGSNAAGQVGDGTLSARLAPVDVPGLSGVSAISTGEIHTCALLGDGTVKCWGSNASGQLGLGAGIATSKNPVSVPGVAGAMAITAGRQHTCALVSQSLVCWGWNADGQFGNGSASYQTRPVSVLEGSFASALALSGCSSPVTAGTACSVTVAAKTPADLTAVTYAGTVDASSSDDLAILPPPYTFIPGDAGAHAFSLIFNRAGTHHLTFADAADGLSATLSNIVVTAGSPSAITAVGGAAQSAIARATFASPLAAKVTDTSGNPVAGAIVTFSAPQSGPSATFAGAFGAVANTGGDGVAISPAPVANGNAGSYAVVATTLGVGGSASFALDNLPPLPASVLVYAGSPQSATIGANFASPLRAVVRDADGNIVVGASVHFALPSSGASGTFTGGALMAVVATDAHGIADSPLVTSNAIVGAFVATATVSGVVTPAQFALTNLTLGAASVVVVSGDAQSTATGHYFAGPLVVKVLDSAGAPVSGTTVAFSAIAPGASANLSASIVTSGANGQAQVFAQANETFGTYSVTASVAGVATHAVFTLTNLARSHAFAASGGQLSSCAIDEIGSVSCWGSNGAGQLGQLPSGGGSSMPVTVGGLGGPSVALGLGAFHACAVSLPGAVACWGFNSHGQLGDGSTAESPAPVPVVGLPSGAVAVDAGEAHTCALTRVGEVKCWGDNVAGQLGVSALPESSVPLPVAGLGPSTALSAGGMHTCAIDGVVKCWGSNSDGQLGDGTFAASSAPVSTGIAAVAVSSGGAFTCVVTPAGGVKCWGNNSVGQLGNDMTSGSAMPTDVVGLTSPVVAVAAGSHHACALDAAGSVKCWGWNDAGQLGFGAAGGISRIALEARIGTAAIDIAAGYRHTCARLAGGAVMCWGSNASGQLGDSTTTDRSVPTDLPMFGGRTGTIGTSSGSGQNATVQMPFSQALRVVVRDADGNPATGHLVAFAPPYAGASAMLSSRVAVVDGAGLAEVNATANETAGAYMVNALSASALVSAAFSLRNDAVAPASVTPVQGSLQTASVGTPYGMTLQAQVKDAAGTPLGGVAVAFTLPPAGASGGFGAGGLSAIATTDAMGLATAPGIVANAVVGTWNATATVVGVATPATFSLTNAAGPPATITVSGGTPQTTIASTLFGALLQATVSDTAGNPVSGATVTFRLPASGPSANFTGGLGKVANAISDANGVAASPTFTATGTAGAFAATASVASIPTTASYSLATVARTGTTVSVVSGSPQSTPAGTAFAEPLVAIVKDASGSPVAGLLLTFTIPGTTVSGTFAGGGKTITLVTDASGTAISPVITPTTRAGTFVPYATVAGLARANFSLAIVAAAPGAATARVGAQTAPVYTTFAKALAVRVTDQYSNVVPNVPVTFTLPPSGASATFEGAGALVTVATDAAGVATTPAVTAGNAVGVFNAEATVPGVAAAVNFRLTNNAGAGATLSIGSGASQSTVVATDFGQPLRVLAQDASARPIAGVPVTFTLPNSTLSATFAGGLRTFQTTTDGSGVANSPVLTASTRTGTFSASARASGITGTQYFALTSLPSSPASVTATTGAQTAPIGSTFAKPLGVLVKDAHGNVVPGVSVAIELGAASPYAQFQGIGTSFSGLTDASGRAVTPPVEARLFVGGHIATSTVAGLPSGPTFSLRNTITPNATVQATGESTQTTAAGTAFASPLRAMVSDASAQPIGGVVVTFTVPTSRAKFPDGTGSAQVATDASGVALSPAITATGVKATWTATARGAGITTGAASYTLTTQ